MNGGLITELTLSYFKHLYVRHAKDDYETIEFVLEDEVLMRLYADSLKNISDRVQEEIKKKRDEREEKDKREDE